MHAVAPSKKSSQAAALNSKTESAKAGCGRGPDRVLLHETHEAALRLCSEGQYEEALNMFGKLLDYISEEDMAKSDAGWLRNLFVIAFRNIAAAQRALGKNEEALECLRVALQKCDELISQEGLPLIDILSEFADLAVETENWEGACDGFDRLLQVLPQTVTLWRNFVRALLHVGDFDNCKGALKRLQDVVHHDGGSLEAKESWLLQLLSTDEGLSACRKRQRPSDMNDPMWDDLMSFMSEQEAKRRRIDEKRWNTNSCYDNVPMAWEYLKRELDKDKCDQTAADKSVQSAMPVNDLEERAVVSTTDVSANALPAPPLLGPPEPLESSDKSELAGAYQKLLHLMDPPSGPNDRADDAGVNEGAAVAEEKGESRPMTSVEYETHDACVAKTVLTCMKAAMPCEAPPALRKSFKDHVDSLRLHKPKPKPDELVKFLQLAGKCLRFDPCQWETWVRAAEALKLQCFVKDDEAELQDSWDDRFNALMNFSRDFVPWAPQLLQVYLHAQAVNLALSLHFSDSLCKLLIVTSEPPQIYSTARHWLATRLNLLLLLRRSRYFGSPRGASQSNGNHRWSWVCRCDYIARQVLWFLVHCSDMVDDNHGLKDVLRMCEDWPKPAFAAPWVEAVQKLQVSKMLIMQESHYTDISPSFIWFIPYIVARLQLKKHANGTHSLPLQAILQLLMAASKLASSCQSSLPTWHLHDTRRKVLKKAQTDAEVMQTLAAFYHNDRAPAAHNMATLNADVWKALRDVSQMHSVFNPLFQIRLSNNFIRKKFYDRVVEAARALFTIPKAYNGKIGIAAFHMADDYRDLVQQDTGKRRRFNSTRSKMLSHCLMTLRALAADVCADEKANVDSRKGGVADAMSGPLLNESGPELCVKALAEIIKGLAHQRSKNWVHLIDLIGLCAAVASDFDPIDANGSKNFFWCTFTDAFRHAVRDIFQKLISESRTHSRPIIAWPLLAMLRALSYYFEGGSHADYVELYIRAMAQVHSFAFKEISCRTDIVKDDLESLPGSPGSLDEAENFYQVMLPCMPEPEGMCKLIASRDGKPSAYDLSSSNCGKQSEILTVNSDDDRE